MAILARSAVLCENGLRATALGVYKYVPLNPRARTIANYSDPPRLAVALQNNNIFKDDEVPISIRGR